MDSQLLPALHAARTTISPYSLTQSALDDLAEQWRGVVGSPEGAASELLAIAEEDGSRRPVTGPRWLFHLLGLPHLVVHIGLSTPSGLVLLQRRSATKADHPKEWCMPAGGHVQEYADGQQASPEEAAFRELDEELFSAKLGLAVRDALRDGELIPVGDPYSSITDEPDRTPPFLDREIRQIYAGTLTEYGLAQMQPDEVELSGVLMCSRVQAWDALEWPSIAPGARVSLPRYLRWLEGQCTP